MEFITEYSWAIAMIVALIIGVFTGYPVAFLLCGLGILFAIMSGIPLRFMGTVVSKFTRALWQTGCYLRLRFSYSWA